MTNIAPPKLLSLYLRTQEITDYWPGTPGVDDAAGEPRQWRFIVDVNAQLHSSHGSLKHMQYDATDIKVGDYITTMSNARFLVIDEIINVVTTGQIEIKASDENKFNAVSDATQFANGALIDGAGFLFETKNQMPVLFPLPDVLPAGFSRGFATQILSRFLQSGKHDTLQVLQPGHSLTDGQAVTLNNTGIYVAVDFTTGVADGAKRVIGIVERSGFPTGDHFTIRTIGPVIDINLTAGGPGELYFIDNNSDAGGLINVDPNTLGSQSASQPIYIKINNNTAIFNPAGAMDTESISSGFVVTSLADISNISNASNGDTVYVLDTGDGQWGYYLYIGGSWEVLSTEAGAAVNARSFDLVIDYTSNPITKIAGMGGNSRIVNVSLQITTPFNNGAEITIGDANDTDRFMTALENDTSLNCEFQTFPSYLYTSNNDVDINLYLTANGATQGAARVLITYV